MLRSGPARKPRAPRRGLAGQDDLDFEGTWQTLRSSLQEIHTKNASQLSFEELYRNAYKIVLKKKGDELYDRVRDFEQEWLTQDVKERIHQTLPGSLVPNGAESSGAGTTNERKAAGERLLRALREAWEDHKLCMSMTTDVLMYMDRVYCQDKSKPSIYVAAMALFRDCILRAKFTSLDGHETNILTILTQIILDHVRMDREGEVVNKTLIRSCIYMLEGLYESTEEKAEEKLYLTSVEQHFLEASEAFYKAEGASMMQDMNAGTYCRHTLRRLQEEDDRCRTTLSQVTAPKIQVVVETELIRHRIGDLIAMDSGVRYMIDNDVSEELELILDLNSRVDAKKLELTKAFQKRILELGNDINNAAAAASMAQPSQQQPVEEDEGGGGGGAGGMGGSKISSLNQQTVAALKWVDDVLALRDKFTHILKTSFRSDQVLETALTRSLTDAINLFPRAAEYVSLFIDENMKKGLKNKTETEVDQTLEKAITLLRYVTDKDLFERYYKKHLCKRLLMGKSVGGEVEKMMIGRMKIELGSSFTGKLEAMFTDMSRSEELTQGYKKRVAARGDPDKKQIELNINVLTSMTWPLEIMGATAGNEEQARLKTIFPPAIERLRRGFEQFYGEKHSGRVLTWQSNMGTADVRAVFPATEGKDAALRKERKHELNVSTYAMIILLLFNELSPGASLTFEEVQARSNIPSPELIRNLQSLAVAPKTRILLKEPMSKTVKATDRFSFNESFHSKFLRIKVGVVSAGNKVEGEKERKETEKRNNDSREFAVEAAVVRIMKARKTLTHQLLVNETLVQLSSKFKPDVTMIKKRIESLIEREYLERMEDAETPSYRYLA